MNTKKLSLSILVVTTGLVTGACTPQNFSDVPAGSGTSQAASPTASGTGSDTGTSTTTSSTTTTTSGTSGSTGPTGSSGSTGSTGPNPPQITSAQVACLSNATTKTYAPFSSSQYPQARGGGLDNCELVVSVTGATECSYLPSVNSPTGSLNPQSCSGGTFTFSFGVSTAPVPFMGSRTFTAIGNGGATSIKFESRCLGQTCNFGIAGQVAFPGMALPTVGGPLPSAGNVQFLCRDAGGRFLPVSAEPSAPYYYQGRGGGLDSCLMVIGLTNSAYALYYPGVASTTANPQNYSEQAFDYQFNDSTVPVDFSGTSDFYTVNPQGYEKVTYESNCSGNICNFSTVTSATYSAATE